jgi:hypothetical protein
MEVCFDLTQFSAGGSGGNSFGIVFHGESNSKVNCNSITLGEVGIGGISPSGNNGLNGVSFKCFHTNGAFGNDCQTNSYCELNCTQTTTDTCDICGVNSFLIEESDLCWE